MYERFIEGNIIKPAQPSVEGAKGQSIDRMIDTLIAECGGVSINNGLYRIHTYLSSIHWSDNMQQYFRAVKRTILPFGYDWLGRQYCMFHGIDNVLVMFDPSSVEYFEMAGNVIDFHNKDLAEDRNDTVSEKSFNPILPEIGVPELTMSQCVGHKVPLFLGGQDDYSNYEIVDMEVYWDIQHQIYEQIKNLPPGTKISSIKFKPNSP